MPFLDEHGNWIAKLPAGTLESGSLPREIAKGRVLGELRGAVSQAILSASDVLRQEDCAERVVTYLRGLRSRLTLEQREQERPVLIRDIEASKAISSQFAKDELRTLTTQQLERVTEDVAREDTFRAHLLLTRGANAAASYEFLFNKSAALNDPWGILAKQTTQAAPGWERVLGNSGIPSYNRPPSDPWGINKDAPDTTRAG